MSQCTTAPRALTDRQRDDYERDGYLILRQVFSPFEIALAVLEAEQLVQRRELIHTDNIRCRWQPHVVTDECLFECFDPVIDIGPVCARLARDPRLLDAVGTLYGESAHLFKDKLIFKPPGAKGYDLHQDYIGWKDFPKTFITVLVPLDPSDRSNGCTEVFPGYHHQGYLSPEDGDYHPMPAGVVDESQCVPLELEPGDIALFGAFTPHRSAPNRSEGWRRQLYLSYNADSDGGDRRTAHYREFHHWLKGKYAEYGKHQTYFQ
ncbi:MAG: phytanoyl-CoA dioxygenase family protein [Planctomycetia bacterium]|nr:phytanoyl-CoA dioxygenase family protein [Planctomycetia bacterium]